MLTVEVSSLCSKPFDFMLNSSRPESEETTDIHNNVIFSLKKEKEFESQIETAWTWLLNLNFWFVLLLDF